MQDNNIITQSLLVELLTEELPPKALKSLGQAFADGVHSSLKNQNLLSESTKLKHFATPRRLSVLLTDVKQKAPDYEHTERLMPAKIGITAEGTISDALAKRLSAKGLSNLGVNDLTVQSDGKQDYLFYTGMVDGVLLADGLQAALDSTIHSLPIPKVMHYQLENGESVRFVRPVHSLLALWGDTIVNVSAFGLAADRQTYGHRFMGMGHLRLNNADEYEELLYEHGRVIAAYDQRRNKILEQLNSKASELKVSLSPNVNDAESDKDVQDLLDEVTSLVEYPSVYVGQFDEEFLRVPSECLILTMRLNQKYFPLFDSTSGQLTNQFLIVSNMDISDPENIILGNQRVVKPRLADAQFFYDTDLQIPLSDNVEALKNSVYHNKLGSQYERMQRVSSVSEYLAKHLGANIDLCKRAAYLAKADLNSNMVGEFPELQGVIGSYYAQHAGEDPSVCNAIGHQYDLRINNIVDDSNLVATILFMADRVETLVGIWGIGLKPTGERDPFGLRRAALGLISAYEQLCAGGFISIADENALSLQDLLQFSVQQFADGKISTDTVAELIQYIYDRYRNQLVNSYDRPVVDAVLAVNPALHQVLSRSKAAALFASQPQSASLAAANKRVTNILRKANLDNPVINTDLLQEQAEKDLYDSITDLSPKAEQLLLKADFTENMKLLATAKDVVDTFFDQVMIMADDVQLRDNRLALLHSLHLLMNQVADISRLDS